MIRPGLFLCGVALVVGSACAPAPAAMTDADRADVEASARVAWQEIVDAMGAADQEAVMARVADGAIFAFHGMVWDRGGLATTLGDFYDPVASTVMENFAPLQFDVLGHDAVVVTSQNAQTTTYDEGMVSPLTMSARTFVLVRGEDGAWQVLHGHVSQHIVPTD
ncbi:MAG: nuclear transport factor 2 family protein [Gemmatimonadales bacterium]